MDNKEYKKYVNKKMKKSTIVKDTCIAFVTGGAICTIGQWIKNLLLGFGLSEKPAAAFLTIILIFIGSLLTALGLYSKMGKFAGAGDNCAHNGFCKFRGFSGNGGKKRGLGFGSFCKNVYRGRPRNRVRDGVRRYRGNNYVYNAVFLNHDSAVGA